MEGVNGEIVEILSWGNGLLVVGPESPGTGNSVYVVWDVVVRVVYAGVFVRRGCNVEELAVVPTDCWVEEPIGLRTGLSDVVVGGLDVTTGAGVVVAKI
jgi:hypothetical protein